MQSWLCAKTVLGLGAYGPKIKQKYFNFSYFVHRAMGFPNLLWNPTNADSIQPFLLN